MRNLQHDHIIVWYYVSPIILRSAGTCVRSVHMVENNVAVDGLSQKYPML